MTQDEGKVKNFRMNQDIRKANYVININQY